MSDAGASAGGAPNETPGQGDAGDTSAGGAGVIVPPDCTPTSDVDEPDEDFTDENCDGIDGEVESGVFVSPDGFDDAPGTLREPVQTVGRAVEIAVTGERPVYVCNATYRENLLLTTSASIYGGYDCTRAWRRTKDWAVLESGVGVPLVVQGVDGRVHIERMALRALDATAVGQSSQAAAVVDSTDVSFARVEFQAGSGAPGKPGLAGANAPGIPALPTGDKGDDTSTTDCYTPATPNGDPGFLCGKYATGGNTTTTARTCRGTHATRGGPGGAGGNVWLALNKPGCFFRDSDAGDAGLPGQFHTGDGIWTNASAAQLGQNGAAGTDGLPASLGFGSIVAGLYASSNAGGDGADGQTGFPGKGGNGGNSVGHSGDVCGPDYRPGSGGGQGGVGGCAGLLATGGGGGGGAVALVIANSTVTLAFPRFVVGDGGVGGDGALGGQGESGGQPGVAGNAQSATYKGQSGQAGGAGGDGGDGGPGGGGPAIAVLYSGAAPDVSDAIYEIGVPGTGGEATSGQNGPDGVTGELRSIEEISEDAS
jgi:hypothetical protein